MNNFNINFKRSTNADVKKDYNNMQPSSNISSGNNLEKQSVERINAHDLFSYYTADIIKKDVIFVR